jgi:hypothetical protein
MANIQKQYRKENILIQKNISEKYFWYKYVVMEPQTSDWHVQGKAILDRILGLQEAPRISRQLVHEGDKAVSLLLLLPILPGDIQ